MVKCKNKLYMFDNRWNLQAKKDFSASKQKDKAVTDFNI
jgi:hypothetical protein